MAGPREFYRVLFTAALQDGLFRAKKTEAHSFNIASDLWPVATSFTFQFSVSKSSWANEKNKGNRPKAWAF